MKAVVGLLLISAVLSAEPFHTVSSPLRPTVQSFPQVGMIPSFYKLPATETFQCGNSLVGFGRSCYGNGFINQFRVNSNVPFSGGTVANSSLFGMPGIGLYGNGIPNLYGNLFTSPSLYDYGSNFTYPYYGYFGYPNLWSNQLDFMPLYDHGLNNYTYPFYSYFDYPSLWSYTDPLFHDFFYEPIYSDFFGYPDFGINAYPYSYGYWDAPHASGLWGFDGANGQADWFTPWSSGYINWVK